MSHLKPIIRNMDACVPNKLSLHRESLTQAGHWNGQPRFGVVGSMTFPANISDGIKITSSASVLPSIPAMTRQGFRQTTFWEQQDVRIPTPTGEYLLEHNTRLDPHMLHEAECALDNLLGQQHTASTVAPAVHLLFNSLVMHSDPLRPQHGATLRQTFIERHTHPQRGAQFVHADGGLHRFQGQVPKTDAERASVAQASLRVLTPNELLFCHSRPHQAARADAVARLIRFRTAAWMYAKRSADPVRTLEELEILPIGIRWALGEADTKNPSLANRTAFHCLAEAHTNLSDAHTAVSLLGNDATLRIERCNATAHRFAMLEGNSTEITEHALDVMWNSIFHIRYLHLLNGTLRSHREHDAQFNFSDNQRRESFDAMSSTLLLTGLITGHSQRFDSHTPLGNITAVHALSGLWQHSVSHDVLWDDIARLKQDCSAELLRSICRRYRISY